MSATLTKQATDQLREHLRRLHVGIDSRNRARRDVWGPGLMPKLQGRGGGGGELRVGKLEQNLDHCTIGRIRIYQQLNDDCPPTPTDEYEDVLNITSFLLGSGPLYYIQKVQKFDKLIVFPAQIEECGLIPAGSVNP